MDDLYAELVVIDDDPAVLRGAAALATSIGIRYQTYLSAEEFLRGNKRPAIGCMLIDLHLDGMSGVELIEHLDAKGCDLPMILVSAHMNVPTTIRAMKHGAWTVIEKPCHAGELDDEIRTAIACSIQIYDNNERSLRIQQAISSLSSREEAVMELTITGHTNKAIAQELEISQRTVDRSRASVVDKMDAESVVDVARMVSELRGFEQARAMQRASKSQNRTLVSSCPEQAIAPQSQQRLRTQAHD